MDARFAAGLEDGISRSNMGLQTPLLSVVEIEELQQFDVNVSLGCPPPLAARTIRRVQLCSSVCLLGVPAVLRTPLPFIDAP